MSTPDHPDPTRDPRAFWESHYVEHRARFAGDPKPAGLDHLDDRALEIAAARGREAGVEDRVEWRRHDLSPGLPEGWFDLVLSSYTQSPVALDRVAVLRRAADRVAPGGALLIVGHAGNPSWAPDEDHGVQMPDAATATTPGPPLRPTRAYFQGASGTTAPVAAPAQRPPRRR